MENKNVGYLVIGLAIIIILIILIFNRALVEIVNTSCTMVGHDSCPMFQTIEQQTYLSLTIVGILIILGLFLIFSKQTERIIIRRVKDKRDNIIEKTLDLSQLKPEEKQILKLVQENKAIFQSDIIDKTGFGKAKVTRIIDRLEGNGLVERKRRGMTNVVVLKT
ncbi:MarR family transcriptional regulator [Candidatus Pacearchaeota archaeon]|nr:MarR family transcriptional regulator [Candidatus Pacearchaeota archaeon]